MTKTLLQVLIFTILLFSNGYQSIVTSFMLKPLQHKLLKSIEELIESDVRVFGWNNVKRRFSDQLKYEHALSREGKLVSRDQITSFYGSGDRDTFGFFYNHSIAALVSCDFWKNQIKFNGDGTSSKGIYLIPEPIDTTRFSLAVAPFHPFVERYQQLMDLSLEAGLPMAWKRFYDNDYVEVLFDFYRGRPRTTDEQNLDFAAIIPFFLILAIGHSIALFALLSELFFHDFIKNLSKEYLARRFGKIFRTKPKVRRV